MKDTEIKNLIPNDVSRCSNDTCTINYLCKRYKQRFVDIQNGKKIVPMTNFLGSNNLCEWFLNIDNK